MNLFLNHILLCVNVQAILSCVTWSQSRSCSGLHCVHWADGHRTAEPRQKPTVREHDKPSKDVELFTARAVDSPKHDRLV